MKLRNILLTGTAVLMMVAILVPMMSATASTPTNPENSVPQQTGPTGTPTDPSWLGFSTGRDALSEDLGRRITLVNKWTFEQTEFTFGIANGCVSNLLPSEEPKVYFGWRYLIYLLEGGTYEVRVSFDLQYAFVCDEVTVDADSGTSTGGVPVVGNVVPGSLEIGAQVPNHLGSQAIQFLRQGEFKWVKGQASPGTAWKPFIDEAHANGFKVFLGVVGDKSQIMTEGYRQIYIDYVAGLARDGADAIEVWNEPNFAREWPSGQINGANYVDLLKRAYPAIKAANPNTIVISASPTPTGFFGAAGCVPEGCNDDVYYQQMAAAGAGAYADCIGVHYNEGIISPRQTTGDPRDNYPTRYFQAMLNRAMRNFPGMKACLTEIGYLSPDGFGSLPPEFSWAAGTSVAEQAQWIAEAATLASQLGNVRLFIVFNLNFTAYGADPQGGFALVRPDGTCPGCNALAAIQ